MSLFATLKKILSKLSLGWLIGLSLLAAAALAGIIYLVYYRIWAFLHYQVAKYIINKHKSNPKPSPSPLPSQPVNCQDRVMLALSSTQQYDWMVLDNTSSCFHTAFPSIAFISYQYPTSTIQLNSGNIPGSYIIQYLPNFVGCVDETWYVCYDNSVEGGNNIGSTSISNNAMIFNLVNYSGYGVPTTKYSAAIYNSTQNLYCLTGQQPGNGETNYTLTNDGLVVGNPEDLLNPVAFFITQF